jgi:hypothetical protein
MRRWFLCLTSLGALLGTAGPAPAQVFVRVPFVRVAVDQPPPLERRGALERRGFFPLIDVWSAPPPVIVVPVVPAPEPPLVGVPVVPAPEPAVPAVPPAAPLSHYEFARTFQPAPGSYDLTLTHTRTLAPVRVNFTLPPGTPRVRALPNALVFEYPNRQEVEVRFAVGGQVRVFYDR